MSKASEALRQAALFGIPKESKDRFRSLADELDTDPDWEAIARSLMVKYGTRNGQALIGSGTMRWAMKHVRLEVSRDGDAIALHWEAPPLKPEGV
jgi:hypothetical protein